MAASIKGTAHIFGVNATITNATILSISASDEFDLNETTEDESGVTIETRRDNRARRVNVTVRIRSGYAYPNIGDVIALANLQDSTFNRNYEITEKGQEYVHNQHLEQNLTLVAMEGITYTS